MARAIVVRLALVLVFQTVISFLSYLHVGAAIVNRTIDDTFGDSQTLLKPAYVDSTSGVWKDQTCTDCGINPDTRQTFKGTYSAVTYSPLSGKASATLTFNGTAIWVFFVLVNNAGDGITSITDCKFMMDNDAPVPFRHAPDLTTTEIMYNQLVYSRTDLPFATHRLEIFSDADFNSYINFDYAIYTHDDDAPLGTSPISSQPVTDTGTITTIIPTSSPTPNTRNDTVTVSKDDTTITTKLVNGTVVVTGSTAGSTSSSDGIPRSSDGASQNAQLISAPPVAAIAGGAAGGLILIIFIFVCIFLVRRRRRRNKALQQAGRGVDDGEMMQGTYYNSGSGPYLPAPSHRREASRDANSSVSHLSAPVHVPSAETRSYYPSTLSSGSMYSDEAYSGIARTYADSDAATTVSRTASSAGTLASSNVHTYRHGSRRGDRSRGKQLQVVNESNERIPLPDPLLPPVPPRHPARSSNTNFAPAPAPITKKRFANQERTRQARQAEIDERLRTIEHEINVIGQDIQRRQSNTATTAPLRPLRRKGSRGDGGSSSTREPDVIAEMGQQMRLMQQEIEFLRENQRSEWAQGLTDEPPPGYSPRRPSEYLSGEAGV